MKNVYRISKKCPSKGYCFLLYNESTSNNDEILNDIVKLIEYFCANSLPHNIFCTKENSEKDNGNVVKVFVFPRRNVEDVKEFGSFNIAFCELSGYIPTGSKLTTHTHFVVITAMLVLFLMKFHCFSDKESFDAITECSIVGKIEITCGNVVEEIENDVIRLYTAAGE